MVIARTDRVSTVIGRDESLIDVFISLSPAFERLRNIGMRKVMSRLVTVEQAARMARVDTEELVARLNAHLSGATRQAQDAGSTVSALVERPTNVEVHSTNGGNVMTSDGGARPEVLEHVAPGDVVELDVRAELRAGREPFSMIVAALRTVPPGGVFCVRAIFEPVPLYAVMKRQALDHWTEKRADDDWRVWFHPPVVAAGAACCAAPAASAPDAPPADADGAAASDAEQDVVIIDVRELEPPEPMVRTLAALEQLPAGATLLHINVRVPQFLLPMLAERGFTYDVREQEPDLVRVFIRHSHRHSH